MTDVTVLERLERCYDAIPRVGGARVEAVGPFELFLREGPGHGRTTPAPGWGPTTSRPRTSKQFDRGSEHSARLRRSNGWSR